MNDAEPTISAELRAYIAYLRPAHLEALAQDYLRRIRNYDLPLLRLLKEMPAADQLAINVASLDKFLGGLVAGTARAEATEGLRRWEADEIPGFSKNDFQPRDLVLVGASHEAALVAMLDTYTDDRAVALSIVRELRAYYLQSELAAYETFTRIRDDATQQAARREAAHEAAARRLVEVEEEVGRRTEELQAANEELEAHHEELMAVNDQLNQQTQELAEQRDFSENLVRHVPTGIAYLDRHQIFRWVNPEFASFANLPVDAFTERSFYDLFPRMENPNPRLLAVLESGQLTHLPALALADAAGEETFWDMVYVPMRGRSGQVDGLMLMAHNATVRVRAERLQQRQIDQLQEVDRLKNDFLSILSHELRTPINAIMGFASILDDEIPGGLNPEQHQFIQRILDGSEVLLGLIEDLLDMSRIQAGKFSLSPSQVAPATVLADAVAALTQLAERKGQHLKLEIEGALPTLHADQQRLRQVITNLVGNAIKFGAPADTVIIRARGTADGLCCEVEDHGEGIAAADLPKLFQRFTQLDSGNTRKAGGAGLGLSIVKALVEAHGGEVGVRSEPHVRTVFWFTLPLVAPPA